VPSIHYLIASYGYWGVALAIGLESMGIPIPGETALISAALYAGTTHNMNIFIVIVAASFGAVAGDNLGYLIGRHFGLPLLLRWGSSLRITESKIKLGRYLFAHYGLAVVFFGRFVAVLRALAAFLAGVNKMAWGAFFAANLSGALLWAGGFGSAAYLLGKEVHKFSGVAGTVTLGFAAIALVSCGALIRRNEQQLEAAAEAEFPGPLAVDAKSR
jgi:membrane protein DedA with SNARE-associated domain